MKTGVIFGRFFPVHVGHLDFIMEASCKVSKLYVVLCSDSKNDTQFAQETSFRKIPNPKDRLRFLKNLLKYQENIQVLHMVEDKIPSYPNGWQDWSNEVKALFATLPNHPDVMFTNDKDDVADYQKYLGLEVEFLKKDRKQFPISGKEIRMNPYLNWDFIPNEVKPFFALKVAIVGGESTGKTTMVNKLARAFNTTSAWEYGREYIFSNLGGDEASLQYSDYEKIAFGQKSYIDRALRFANRVAIIDTDYVTTQAFCLEYEHKAHPRVSEFIVNEPFDIVIFLSNDTPWVDDGLRSLGSCEVRNKFQARLKSLYEEYDIPYYFVESADYLERYRFCKQIIQEALLSFQTCTK